MIRRDLPPRTSCFAAIGLIIIGSAACHRATASEVGAADRASAFPMAEMHSSERAAVVSPDVVAQSAKGTPMREAAVGGVPPAAVSHSQP